MFVFGALLSGSYVAVNQLTNQSFICLLFIQINSGDKGMKLGTYVYPSGCKDSFKRHICAFFFFKNILSPDF